MRALENGDRSDLKPRTLKGLKRDEAKDVGGEGVRLLYFRVWEILFSAHLDPHTSRLLKRRGKTINAPVASNGHQLKTTGHRLTADHESSENQVRR